MIIENCKWYAECGLYLLWLLMPAISEKKEWVWKTVMNMFFRIQEKKTVKNTNTRRLNNMLLNNREITEEIKEEIKKYLETNDNENTMTWNLWNAAKAVLRGKFITIQSYLKKQETSQINNLTLHLKELEKEEQTKPKVSRRKESIKIRAEINEKETRKTISKINKTKSWFLRR